VIAVLDASAVARLFLRDEADASAVLGVFDAVDRLAASRLVEPEVRAALAAAARAGRLRPAQHRSAVRRLHRILASVDAVELTPAVARSAGDLAERRRLRGADAVHLASALVLGRDDVVLATFDVQLGHAARAEGLRVAPVPPDGPALPRRRSRG